MRQRLLCKSALGSCFRGFIYRFLNFCQLRCLRDFDIRDLRAVQREGGVRSLQLNHKRMPSYSFDDAGDGGFRRACFVRNEASVRTELRIAAVRGEFVRNVQLSGLQCYRFKIPIAVWRIQQFDVRRQRSDIIALVP